jgi:hypothetical protein
MTHEEKIIRNINLLIISQGLKHAKKACSARLSSWQKEH